jgi:hypothetical protein
MASLLALMNRAVTYFKESKSGTNNGVTTDDDCGSSNKIASSTVNNNRICTECIVCERVVQLRYYMREEQMCQCCHEISLGKDKQCDSCGEFKHITLFWKPKLLYCEQCASNPEGLKHYCHSCKCVQQRGYWHIHIQTEKHRLSTYVELPADEYQCEYDECIARNSLFKQSDLLNEHICVKCLIDGNIPKMHCDKCNSDMMIMTSSKHLKSKKHLSNALR